MKLLLIAILILTMDLKPTLTMALAFTPEDQEGSGHDELDGSGSDSGDWSEEQGSAASPGRFTKISTIEMKKNQDDSNTNNEDTITAAKGTGGARNQIHDDSDLIFDVPQWSVDDIGADVGKSKSFLENKEVLASIIAGGVAGVVLAVALAAVLIYNMKRKDDAGYTLAQQNASH